MIDSLQNISNIMNIIFISITLFYIFLYLLVYFIFILYFFTIKTKLKILERKIDKNESNLYFFINSLTFIEKTLKATYDVISKFPTYLQDERKSAKNIHSRMVANKEKILKDLGGFNILKNIRIFRETIESNKLKIKLKNTYEVPNAKKYMKKLNAEEKNLKKRQNREYSRYFNEYKKFFFKNTVAFSEILIGPIYLLTSINGKFNNYPNISIKMSEIPKIENSEVQLFKLLTSKNGYSIKEEELWFNSKNYKWEIKNNYVSETANKIISLLNSFSIEEKKSTIIKSFSIVENSEQLITHIENYYDSLKRFVWKNKKYMRILVDAESNLIKRLAS